jgi:hypothetical protein
MPMQPAGRRFHRRQWASVIAPAHKSDLNALSSQHACPRKWLYEQRELERGRGQDDDDAVVWGRAALGSATHETLAWFLAASVWRKRILTGPGAVTLAQVKRVYFEMFDRAVGERRLEWSHRDRAETLHEERLHMVHGALEHLHERVHSIELIEAAFIVELGEYWLSGHVDLVYRPRDAPDTIGLADWKTGTNKPDQIELDHGWEAGVYSAALHHGRFIRRESVQLTAADPIWVAECCGVEVQHGSKYRAERTALENALMLVAQGAVAPELLDAHVVRYDQFPSAIHHVHLGDYVPYKRSGKKAVRRPEDLRHYGIDTAGASVEYVAGDLKGPAWIPVARTEHDIPRLLHRTRTVVAMVRLNVFPDNVGERCRRCAYARHCLTTGYAPSGAEGALLDEVLRGAGSAAHQDLSIDD